jgi:RecA/RadA recombinase
MTINRACERKVPGDGYQGKGEQATQEKGQTLARDFVKSPLIVSMSDIKAETIKWLWPGYIPLGKLTFLEGDPGLGKTFVALKIATHISRGEAFPSNDYRPPLESANVLYMTAEDGLGDTLKPRLEAAGAECSRVFVLKGWQGEIEGKELEGLISLADVDLITKAIETLQPALVVIDPIQGYMGGKTDIHRANEVREVLTPVVKLAEKYGCAVLAIRHLNKSKNSKALYSGMGSIDFAAAARSILRVDRMPDNPQSRVVVQVKNNLAKFASALEFRIENSVVKWLSEVDVLADDLAQDYGIPKDSSALDEAVDFLQTVLADGARSSRDVKRESLELGITESTLKRAKKELDTQTRRVQTGEGRGEGSWFIALSQKDLDVLSTNLEPLKPDKRNTVTDEILKEVQANILEPLKQERLGRENLKEVKGVQDVSIGENQDNEPTTPRSKQNTSPTPQDEMTTLVLDGNVKEV